MRTMVDAALAVVLLFCGTAACSDTEAGFGIPRQPSPSAFPGQRQAIAGVVAVQANGCVDLDLGQLGRRWVIWPHTTRAVDGGAAIVLGGRVVADGDALRGSGMVADATQLPVWDKAYGLPLEMFGRYCSADKHGVVVLDAAAVSTG
jgi:hypothetical protein